MATGGIEQRLSLTPTPDSARTARRFVADVLATARADAFVDSATLLTSELVTNGIVHAHTDLQVVVDATPTWVRVEVADGDPRLPARREYDDAASTGRGLEMVELLADDFGVEPLEDGGKRVWFRLGVAPGAPGTPDVHGIPEPGGETTAATTSIQLLALPVALYCAWQQHADALLREATLAAYDESEDDGGNGDFPLAGRALGALAAAATETFDLRDRGVMTVDLSLDMDSAALPWFPILRDLLGRATSMSVAGQLLVPPSLPEIVALRNWICDEVARQAADLAPTAWAGMSGDDHDRPEIALATLEGVRAATTAQVAADASNRIVAISAAAAELLGWDPSELEGRRLVAIIPSRLRDLHVAGFTRHLLEGTSRIIGQPVSVPALRRDGTEIDVTLQIERRSDRATRALFVATLTPREPATGDGEETLRGH